MGVNWGGDFDPWQFFVILVTIVMLIVVLIYVFGVFFPELRFW